MGLKQIIFMLLVVGLGLTSCKTNKRTTYYKRPAAKPSTSKPSSTKKPTASKPSTPAKKPASKPATTPPNTSEDYSFVKTASLKTFIKDWYATPYKFGGNDKSGVDCSGFTCSLYKTIYKKTLKRTSTDQFDQCEEVSKANLKEGDLIFFKINSSKISHVGVYIGQQKFVHASTSKGVIVSSLEQEYYEKYYYKAGRLK